MRLARSLKRVCMCALCIYVCYASMCVCVCVCVCVCSNPMAVAAFFIVFLTVVIPLYTLILLILYRVYSDNWPKAMRLQGFTPGIGLVGLVGGALPCCWKRIEALTKLILPGDTTVYDGAMERPLRDETDAERRKRRARNHVRKLLRGSYWYNAELARLQAEAERGRHFHHCWRWFTTWLGSAVRRAMHFPHWSYHRGRGSVQPTGYEASACSQVSEGGCELLNGCERLSASGSCELMSAQGEVSDRSKALAPSSTSSHLLSHADQDEDGKMMASLWRPRASAPLRSLRMQRKRLHHMANSARQRARAANERLLVHGLIKYTRHRLQEYPAIVKWNERRLPLEVGDSVPGYPQRLLMACALSSWITLMILLVWINISLQWCPHILRASITLSRTLSALVPHTTHLLQQTQFSEVFLALLLVPGVPLAKLEEDPRNKTVPIIEIVWVSLCASSVVVLVLFVLLIWRGIFCSFVRHTYRLRAGHYFFEREFMREEMANRCIK